MRKAETRKAFLEEDIAINPPLPEYLNSTPNDVRPEWRIEVLWDTPSYPHHLSDTHKYCPGTCKRILLHLFASIMRFVPR